MAVIIFKYSSIICKTVTVSATGVITIINGGNYFVEYSVDGAGGVGTK